MAVSINKNGNELSEIIESNETQKIENNERFEIDINTTNLNNDSISSDFHQSLSSSELSDPNSIVVTIANKSIPIVVLFGPPRCGKTMTLVRLTRYLKKNGYTISPIRTFRPANDINYSKICENYNTLINSDLAADSTNRISFMLVEITKNGKPICQILEAPGEYYFDRDRPNNPYPSYVNTIFNSENRKIWSILIEPDWYDDNDRRNYVNRITKLKTKMRNKDKTIFIFNKIDKTNFVIRPGYINIKEAVNNIENLYPNIFVPFYNQIPITKIWRKYNCDFVPFQTGDYTSSINGLTYQEGPEEYCSNLWNTLIKNIKG